MVVGSSESSPAKPSREPVLLTIDIGLSAYEFCTAGLVLALLIIYVCFIVFEYCFPRASRCQSGGSSRSTSACRRDKHVVEMK